MSKPSINFSDKLETVEEVVDVHIYDNGFMVSATGRNKNDDWSQVKLMCHDIEQVTEYLTELATLPLDR